MKLPINSIKHMQIAMGNLCNQHCSFCYQEDRSSAKNINDLIWKDKLLPIYNSLNTVTIIGGEPTIMKNAWECLNFLSSNYSQILFKTISNGINFNSQWRDIFLERGEKVIFSINAASKATFDQIIYNGNWKRTIANIEGVLQNRIGSSLQVHASYVVTAANVHEITDFIRMMKSMGVDKCIFVRDFVKGFDISSNSAYIIDGIEAARDLSIEVYGLEEMFGSYLSNTITMNCDQNRKEAPMCSLPWNSIDITQDGFVSFCCSAYLPIGNLYENGICEIWNSTIAEDMRDAISKGNYRMCKQNCTFDPNPRRFYLAAGKTRAIYWEHLYLMRRYIAKILHDPIGGSTAMIRKAMSRINK